MSFKKLFRSTRNELTQRAMPVYVRASKVEVSYSPYEGAGMLIKVILRVHQFYKSL